MQTRLARNVYPLKDPDKFWELVSSFDYDFLARKEGILTALLVNMML